MGEEGVKVVQNACRGEGCFRELKCKNAFRRPYPGGVLVHAPGKRNGDVAARRDK